ncbi:MAG: hypothetical protein VX733_07365 [Candidatus Latescibacterota bacterium]|nr:hypothetical protein [Candidatus Latescibacterota bacterium]
MCCEEILRTADQHGAKGKAAELDSGVIAELGNLGAGAVVTEAGLARMFHRHPASIKRAVTRRELPAPCRLLGQNVWTVGTIRDHIEQRMEDAARESTDATLKVLELSP